MQVPAGMDNTGEPQTMFECETVRLKGWHRSETIEVDVLPAKVYDLIVSINMMEFKGEFNLRFEGQDPSKPGPAQSH
jgi:hypothetical protein